MSHRLLPTWTAVTFLLPWILRAVGDQAEDALGLGIVCFNMETVEVTWGGARLGGDNLTLTYRFDNEPSRPCPRYLVEGGYTAGCVLDADDALLSFSIWNGTQCLLTKIHEVIEYLKPPPPQNLVFAWLDDSLTVTCSNLSYKGLLYEVQHRSRLNSAWESMKKTTCHMTLQGLDAEKCYEVRARILTQDSYFGQNTHPSDWSEVTRWQGAQLTASCQAPAQTMFPSLALICSLLGLLLLFLLVLCEWRLQRVKRFVLPCVPDPKCTFPGLFEMHHGNFQEWISDTQHVVPFRKDEEGSREDILVVQVSQAEAGPPPWRESQTVWGLMGSPRDP